MAEYQVSIQVNADNVGAIIEAFAKAMEEDKDKYNPTYGVFATCVHGLANDTKFRQRVMHYAIEKLVGLTD